MNLKEVYLFIFRFYLREIEVVQDGKPHASFSPLNLCAGNQQKGISLCWPRLGDLIDVGRR